MCAAGTIARPAGARASADGAAADEGSAVGVTVGATIAADGAAAGGRLDGPPVLVQPATARDRMNQDRLSHTFAPPDARTLTMD